MITKAAGQMYRDMGPLESSTEMEKLVSKDGNYGSRLMHKLPKAVGVGVPFGLGAGYAFGRLAARHGGPALRVGAMAAVPTALMSLGYANSSVHRDLVRESNGKYRQHPGFWKGKLLGVMQKRRSDD